MNRLAFRSGVYGGRLQILAQPREPKWIIGISERIHAQFRWPVTCWELPVTRVPDTRLWPRRAK